MQLQGETAVLNIIQDLDRFCLQARYVAKATGIFRPDRTDNPNIKNRNKGSRAGYSGWDRIRILNSPVTSAKERHISRGAEQRPGYAAGTAAWKCLFLFTARNLKSARKRCSWKLWTPAAFRQVMRVPGQNNLGRVFSGPRRWMWISSA